MREMKNERKIKGYMGFNFSFFGKQEVRRFSYKPRFYDPEAEERRKKYGDFTKPKAEDYVPGSHVKGSLRDGNDRVHTVYNPFRMVPCRRRCSMDRLYSLLYILHRGQRFDNAS